MFRSAFDGSNAITVVPLPAQVAMSPLLVQSYLGHECFGEECAFLISFLASVVPC
jgi:hypothetical protein